METEIGREGTEWRCGGKKEISTLSVVCVEFLTGGSEGFIWCDPLLFFLLEFAYFHVGESADPAKI